MVDMKLLLGSLAILAVVSVAGFVGYQLGRAPCRAWHE
jgi:hypothetical protein